MICSLYIFNKEVPVAHARPGPCRWSHQAPPTLGNTCLLEFLLAIFGQIFRLRIRKPIQQMAVVLFPLPPLPEVLLAPRTPRRKVLTRHVYTSTSALSQRQVRKRTWAPFIHCYTPGLQCLRQQEAKSRSLMRCDDKDR